jgi:hypothetical protein
MNYALRRRVLVTGGAGFLGSHLCERLLADGHDVICLDNFFTGTKDNIAHLLDNPYFELLRHDVTFPLYVEVDEIDNLACPASPTHVQFDPVQTTKTSVHGAINMLGLAKRVKAKIFQASTGEVYGDPTVHPQPEHYWGNVNPIGPRSCYDEGKRCAETPVLRLPAAARASDQGGAHLQHLRAAHAPQRWSGGGIPARKPGEVVMSARPPYSRAGKAASRSPRALALYASLPSMAWVPAPAGDDGIGAGRPWWLPSACLGFEPLEHHPDGLVVAPKPLTCAANR